MYLASYISSMFVKPLPPFLGSAYNLFTSLAGCNPPVIVIVFLVMMSRSSISFLVQSRIPTVGVMIGTAKMLCTVTLICPLTSKFQIFLTLFLYSFVSEIRMRSSANARHLRQRLLEMLTPMDGGRTLSKSLRMRLKRIGLRGSPCFTPHRSLILGRLVGPQRMVVVQLE